MKLRRTMLAVLSGLLVLAAPGYASDGGPLDFGLGITIGAASFPDPASAGSITYQSLGMTPDLAIGKFGIGLDLTLNYRFTGGDGTQFEIRREDWIPSESVGFLELYLPKFRYVRWGLKGDPLYVKAGSFEDATLGNGFIMGNYANTRYLPDRKLFGLALDVDGALFGFPYVGVETFAGNLAVFDVIGTRLFVRPLAWSRVPIIRNLQVGGTLAIDRSPFHFAKGDPDAVDVIPSLLPDGITREEASVFVWGADFRLPVLSNPIVSLAGFGDLVIQNQTSGAMVGAGGRLFGLMTYGAQLRFLGANFIPVYFDGSYDLFRPYKYALYAGADGYSTEPFTGWFATAGFSLLDDQLVFAANVDGPFGEVEGDPTVTLPHLLATFLLEEGLLGGLSFQASYDKRAIESLADLLDPTNSVIGARLNYRVQNAVISLVYDLKYNPFPAAGQDPWTITSRIETQIKLF